MKRILSILIVLVLAFSAVPVFAVSGSGKYGDFRTEIREEIEEHSSEEHSSDIRERMKSEVRERLEIKGGEIKQEIKTKFKVRGLELALQRCKESGQDQNKCEEVLKRVMERKEEHKERVKGLLESEGFRKFKEGKAREVFKEKHKELESKFKERHEFALKVREEIKEKRADLEDLKDVFEECEANPSEECKSKLADRISDLKDYISSVYELVNTEVDKLDAKLDSSEDLTEDEAAKIYARVDSSLNELSIAKDKVNALSELSTKEEVKQALNGFKQAFSEIRHSVKGESEALVHARIGGIVVKSEHLGKKMNSALERLAEKGADVTQVESLTNSFNEHLRLAAEKYQEAQTKFKDARETKNEELYKEAIALVQEAKEHLKLAHEVLKDAFHELKEHGEEKSLTTEKEIEIEIEGNQAKIEVEAPGIELEFTLQTNDIDVIVAEIASRTGLTQEEIRSIMEVEFEDE